MGALFLTLVFCFILAVVYFTYLLIVTVAGVARRVTWRSDSKPVELFTRIEAEKLKEYEQAREKVRNKERSEKGYITCFRRAKESLNKK